MSIANLMEEILTQMCMFNRVLSDRGICVFLQGRESERRRAFLVLKVSVTCVSGRVRGHGSCVKSHTDHSFVCVFFNLLLQRSRLKCACMLNYVTHMFR